jgi:hypothetical protein
MDLQNLIISFIVGSGILGLIFAFIAGWIAKKILPALEKGKDAPQSSPEYQAYMKRWARAQEIALIVSRITDTMVNNLPNTKVDDYFADLVKKVIADLKLDPSNPKDVEIATREVTHQLKKRGLLT